MACMDDAKTGFWETGFCTETADYIKGQSWNFCSTGRGCHNAIKLATRTTPWSPRKHHFSSCNGEKRVPVFLQGCVSFRGSKPFSIFTVGALIKTVPTELVGAWITKHVLLKGKSWNVTRSTFFLLVKEFRLRECAGSEALSVLWGESQRGGYAENLRQHVAQLVEHFFWDTLPTQKRRATWSARWRGSD